MAHFQVPKEKKIAGLWTFLNISYRNLSFVLNPLQKFAVCYLPLAIPYDI